VALASRQLPFRIPRTAGAGSRISFRCLDETFGTSRGAGAQCDLVLLIAADTGAMPNGWLSIQLQQGLQGSPAAMATRDQPPRTAAP
jgi:hypothetical protein